jgi:hypothetical protein
MPKDTSKNLKIKKWKLGIITGLIADTIFLVGVPLRQMTSPLKFFSGLHGNTAQAAGLTVTGTIIGALLAFGIYFIVGCLSGYIYERLC